jgi:hypothetical protein
MYKLLYHVRNQGVKRCLYHQGNNMDLIEKSERGSHLEDLDADGKIILRWIWNEKDPKLWTSFIWTWTDGG